MAMIRITTEDGEQRDFYEDEEPKLFAAWKRWVSEERGSAAESLRWVGIMQDADELMDGYGLVTDIEWIGDE